MFAQDHDPSHDAMKQCAADDPVARQAQETVAAFVDDDCEDVHAWELV